MDCYSFTDESSLQTEMHLPLLSDSELPIASNIQRQEFISDPDDIIYAGMTSIELDSNLEAAEIPGDPFADNVDLSLYTVDKGCDSPKILSDSTDTDSPPTLLGISPLPQKSTPEKGASKGEGKYGGLQKRRRLSARHSPQQVFQECSQCGKSFSSASALSKHYLTHSHERRHVCRICNKAFKRQDHLSGHLLTHQKNKPYVCMEHGCDKSYCDSRSLRRHYEVQHGLYCQREPFADSSSKDVDSTESMLYLQSGHTQTLQCEVEMAQRPTPQVESLSQRSALPNRELLRPLTSSLSQKMPCDTGASGSKITLHYPTQAHATASALTSPSICLSERSGTVRQAKYSIAQREHSSSLNCNMSDPYNRVNSSHFSVADPTVSCVESLDSYVMDSVIPARPSQPAQYALESSRPASWPQAVSTNHTLSRNETVSARQQPSQDLVWTNNLATYSGSKGSYSYIVPNSQPPEEVSATFSSGALHKLDSFAQAFTRQNLDIQSNPSTAKSLGENSAVSEFDACGNVFRQLLSYKANLNQWQTFPEQKHQILQEQYSLQHQQQIATSLFTQVYMGEQEASPMQNQDQFQNHMLQLISDTQYNLSQSQNSVSQSQVLVTQSQHVLAQKIPSQIQNNGSQSHHPSELAQDFQHSLRQEITSPFLQFQTAKQCQLSKNILPCYPQETESTEQQTGPGLQPALRGVSECHKKPKKSPFKAQHTPQSVCEEDVVPNQLQSPSEQQLEGWSLPPCSNKRGRISNKDVCIKHYTVTGKSSKSVSVSRKERQKLDPNCTAPPSQVAMNSFSVQNSLTRSMEDYLQKASFHASVQVTDNGIEKMEHGGLFFQYLEDKLSALLLKKPLEESVAMPLVIPVSVPVKSADGVDGIYGISVVKDDSIVTIEPHINIGSRFQAEIPLLQDKSLVDDRVHQADLVWKPWDDIETNKVTQARVTDLLNLACSSVLPGGGTNLELALHCLHDTRGDILAALEVLLMKGVRRDPCHPLGDYHYTGTEKWTTAEKKMFNKAICLHNKDFFLMQKMIKYKTVAQCVEYYYTWKKQLKFEWKRTHLLEEEEIKREADSPADGKEIKKLVRNAANYAQASEGTCRQSFIASQGLSIPSQTSVSREKLKKKIVRAKPSPSPSVHCQTGVQDKNEKKFILGNFPCKECTKVFDKVKSRNAHMKCHRQQEEQERQAEMKRSRIRLKVEPKEEPEETILVFTSNNLPNITTP
ncbi:zinc finger protein 541-like [Scyliorhinus torazame]|uniref:zinc finger protein 541-like n=1 Tax=Scyliorhinus torazame TaxID=75743 RepID=UPI003B597E7F